MANHKSALKRARQNEIRRLRNKGVSTRVKNTIKDVRLAIEEGPESPEDKEAIMAKLNFAESVIHVAAKKGVIHKNNAGRKISRLTKAVNAAIS